MLSNTWGTLHPLSPAVTAFCRNSAVARFAQTHQVVIIMGSAFRQRNDMMNFLSRGQPVILKTFLAQRMCLYIFVPYAFPRPAITFAVLGIALVSIHLLRVKEKPSQDALPQRLIFILFMQVYHNTEGIVENSRIYCILFSTVIIPHLPW